MVKFRFSIILLCVLMPPVLYVGTVALLEQYAASKVRAGLERTFLGPVQPLLDGTQRLQTAVARNVRVFLANNRWIAWGGKAVVTIRTDGNILLYPAADLPSTENSEEFGPAPWQVAAENFRLLNDNPTVVLDFRLPHNSPITNAVLAVYITVAIGLLFFYFRGWRARYQQVLAQQDDAQQRLAQQGRLYEIQLAAMEAERTRLSREMVQVEQKLQETKRRAETTEEEMVEELVTLEQAVADKADEQARFQAGMAELQQKIDQLESQLQKEQARKAKAGEGVQKRMAALYKHVVLSERAVSGYLDLTEEMKIRCEEVIHQLDADPSKLTIKRKVFGKKNRATVFELVFGYKGRVYYLGKEGRRSEVLVIGTKNSQQQDLEYLNRL